MPRLAKLLAGRAAGPAARPGGPRRDPGGGGLAPAAGGAAAALPPDRHALGPHVPAGRPAGLRAAAGAQHRRHGRARRPDPAGVLLRLPHRRRRQPDAVLPGHQLRPWRPGGGAGDDHRPAYRARPVRWRRALRRDLRRLALHLHDHPLGARPHARASACRWNSSSSGRPARPPTSSASTTAAGWRSARRRTSTSSTWTRCGCTTRR